MESYPQKTVPTRLNLAHALHARLNGRPAAQQLRFDAKAVAALFGLRHRGNLAHADAEVIARETGQQQLACSPWCI